MQALSRAFYEVVYERDFLKKKGDAFQDFFAEIMEKGYPGGDFVRVRPWGSVGDRKNDGYVRSRRMLFQVYAPNEMSAAKAKDKIEEDFRGALVHWKKFFDHWVFVHNDRKGLSPEIATTLLSLNEVQAGVDVRQWGFNEIREELFRLRDEDVMALLGPAPSLRDFGHLGFEKLKEVLLAVGRQPAPIELDLFPVPREKVEINRLSKNTEILINAGRRKSPLVRDFFSRFPDPQLGDEVVQAFKTKYLELKAMGRVPDRIFQDLMIFGGGETVGDTGHQAAVLAVLAYLFDQCDIYESSVKGVRP
jgi:hypothetical protein